MNIEIDQITLHLNESGDALRGDTQMLPHMNSILQNNSFDSPLILKNQFSLRQTSRFPIVKMHPSEERISRWTALNKLIGSNVNVTNKSKKMNRNPSFSSMTMNDVGKAFPLQAYVEDIKYIPEDRLQELHNSLTQSLECYKIIGETILTSELAVKICISAVLVFVCNLFKGEVKIVTNDHIVGKEVKSQGSIEIVLMIGTRRVIIVLAKESVIDGLSENLVGCEVTAEIEQVDLVYGIISTFRDWTFIKSCNDEILFDVGCEAVINQADDIRIEGLRHVAGKLYSILNKLVNKTT